jgi:hypothetical protein
MENAPDLRIRIRQGDANRRPPGQTAQSVLSLSIHESGSARAHLTEAPITEFARFSE